MDAAVLARENTRLKARPAEVAATPAGTQEADRRLQDMPDILRAVRRPISPFSRSIGFVECGLARCRARTPMQAHTSASARTIVLGPCLDGFRGAGGSVIFGLWSGAARDPASRLRRCPRALMNAGVMPRVPVKGTRSWRAGSNGVSRPLVRPCAIRTHYLKAPARQK
jgi:hypothetical protein